MDYDAYWRKYGLKKRMAGPKGRKRPVCSAVVDYAHIDRFHMREALIQALQAGKRGEVPVGAVLCRKGKTLVFAENQVEERASGLCHAEMIALKAGGDLLGRRLSDCTLYVTMEPCSMCAGAMINARLGRLVYGTADPERGACGSMVDVLSPRANLWKIRVRSGVLEEPCRALIRLFFQSRREKKPFDLPVRRP